MVLHVFIVYVLMLKHLLDEILMSMLTFDVPVTTLIMCFACDIEIFSRIEAYKTCVLLHSWPIWLWAVCEQPNTTDKQCLLDRFIPEIFHSPPLSSVDVLKWKEVCLLWLSWSFYWIYLTHTNYAFFMNYTKM